MGFAARNYAVFQSSSSLQRRPPLVMSFSVSKAARLVKSPDLP